MSETATIRKSVDVEVEVSASCTECSRRLNFNLDVDRAGDLSLSVERCDCKDDEIRKEGYEDGHGNGYEEGVEGEQATHICEVQS